MQILSSWDFIYIIMSNDEPNGLAWWVGWRPKRTIIVLFFIGLILGIAFDSIVFLSFIGMVAAVGLWGWGVSVINTNFIPLRDEFFESSRSQAENTLGFDPEETQDSYNLRLGVGNSPRS